MNDLLFVYGTLRPGVKNSRAELFVDEAELLGVGRVRGSLYDLGAYPGLFREESGSAWVTGVVYRLREPELTLLELDVYEGATSGSDDDYQRVELAVTLESEQEVLAWAYLYRGSLQGSVLITSGDWAAVRDD
jgi:gamma-glutamylcyclotransferase (GGCT)/AIG2-like uncharacterized protein YtfP